MYTCFKVRYKFEMQLRHQEMLGTTDTPDAHMFLRQYYKE